MAYDRKTNKFRKYFRLEWMFQSDWSFCHNQVTPVWADFMFSVRFRHVRLPEQVLPLASKLFELNFRYLGQIYRFGEMYWMTFPWPWPKVTSVASISKNLLVCTTKWELLIHPITTERSHFIVHHGNHLVRFWRKSVGNYLVQGIYAI